MLDAFVSIRILGLVNFRASGINVQIHKEMMCAGHQEGNEELKERKSFQPLGLSQWEGGIQILIHLPCGEN